MVCRFLFDVAAAFQPTPPASRPLSCRNIQSVVTACGGVLLTGSLKDARTFVLCLLDGLGGREGVAAVAVVWWCMFCSLLPLLVNAALLNGRRRTVLRVPSCLFAPSLPPFCARRPAPARFARLTGLHYCLVITADGTSFERRVGGIKLCVAMPVDAMTWTWAALHCTSLPSLHLTFFHCCWRFLPLLFRYASFSHCTRQRAAARRAFCVGATLRPLPLRLAWRRTRAARTFCVLLGGAVAWAGVFDGCWRHRRAYADGQAAATRVLAFRMVWFKHAPRS